MVDIRESERYVYPKVIFISSTVTLKASGDYLELGSVE